jgi:hypothetical protein
VGRRGHGEIDEVDDAGCGVCGHDKGEEESHAGEADGAAYRHAEHLGEFGRGEVNVSEGDANDGEDGDDDEAEGDCGGAFGEEVGRDGHGACAFEFEPSGGEIGGEADTDAEES